MHVEAMMQVRRMHGGTQSQLLHCSDGRLYIVKFQKNPQGTRVLANEWIASHLLRALGLPVPQSAVVHVGPNLLAHSPALRFETANGCVPVPPGLHYGSRFALDDTQGEVFDLMPNTRLERVSNLNAFAGVLAFDLWAGNADMRQAVFCRSGTTREYRAVFIDHGQCFNGESWFLDNVKPKQSLYWSASVYTGITGWHSFEPWLSRIELLDEALWRAVCDLPREWYSGNQRALEELLRKLCARRRLIRTLINELIAEDRFPGWRHVRAAAA